MRNPAAHPTTTGWQRVRRMRSAHFPHAAQLRALSSELSSSCLLVVCHWVPGRRQGRLLVAMHDTGALHVHGMAWPTTEAQRQQRKDAVLQKFDLCARYTRGRASLTSACLPLLLLQAAGGFSRHGWNA